jgi:D-amino peptidase
MKILIAADMEGITGVVHWDQVNPSHPEYIRFRKLMTEDVNAAVRGAASAGAEQIIVTDGHANGRNILIEELDGRARLHSGTIAPLSMVEGVAEGVDGVFFIGYHARIGTPYAILEHTWSDERVADFWLRGADQAQMQPTGEIGLNAALCGSFGAAVWMISGDLAACSEASQLLGPIETAVVKKATGRMAADCLPPIQSHALIEQAARQACIKLSQALSRGEKIQPFIIKPPIQMAIDFVQSEMADKAALLPGASRTGRRVEYTGQDMGEIFRAFRTALALAR